MLPVGHTGYSRICRCVALWVVQPHLTSTAFFLSSANRPSPARDIPGSARRPGVAQGECRFRKVLGIGLLEEGTD
jgi:hypothetical protein